MKEFLKKTHKFFTEDIWEKNLNNIPFIKKLGFSSLRVINILYCDFTKHKGSLHAAALSNITLMALVPALAFICAIAKGLKFYTNIKEYIIAQITKMSPELTVFIEELFTSVEKTNFSALGIIGLLFTMWTVISLISRIESSFNLIWGVKENRSFSRKFTDYISILSIVPIILLIVSSINTFLTSQKAYDFFGNSTLTIIIIRIFSFFCLSFALYFLYSFLPNTKVKFKSAFIAAIISSFVWAFVLFIYIYLQIGLNNLNIIYGSFVSIPLFLMLLYFFYLMIIFGSCLSFAIEHHKNYEKEQIQFNFTSLQTLSLFFLCDISKNFIKGNAWQLEQTIKKYNIPFRIANQAMSLLREKNLIIADKNTNNFVPAQDITSITIKQIKDKIQGKIDPNIKNLNLPYQLHDTDKLTLKEVITK